ncbi:hypothetical protein ACFE04_008982 [Oxalis oulophora]
MASSSVIPPSVNCSEQSANLAPGSNDETPRVKFLCSFLGSILPRPQDGKLRYVGGETRILSVPRDISYEELMNRMRELYEGAAVLKYQQPDEDLDALVSVVNDDDVTNMMEEYEKLGSGDGFIRLRIFLFSHPELDGALNYVDSDDRESERRYVDALNHLNDAPDIQKLYPESPVIGPLDDPHGPADPFFLDNMAMPPYNMNHLKVPQIGLGQHPLPPVTQRFSDVESTWSPSYYSPRNHVHHDPRGITDFPSSPSSARFGMPLGEMPDKTLPEEFTRQQINNYPSYDHQPQFSENLAWIPPSDKTGFPGNLFHSPNIYEGNSVCQHCRVPFHRTQSHLEQPNMVNGFPQVPNLCGDCPSRTNLPLGHGESHHFPPGYAHHRAGPELGNEVFHDQNVAASPHLHLPPHEERGTRYGNIPYAYGGDNGNYLVSHGHGQPVWRNPQNPLHTNPSYEMISANHLVNNSVNPAYLRGDPRFNVGVDNQNPWFESSQKIMGKDGVVGPEYSYGPQKLHPNIRVQDNNYNKHSFTPDISWPQPSMPSFAPLRVSPSSLSLIHENVPPSTSLGHNPERRSYVDLNEAVEKLNIHGEQKEANRVENIEESANMDCLKPLEEDGAIVKDPSFALSNPKLSVENLSFLPDLVASAKKAALEEAEEVKVKAVENSDPVKQNSNAGIVTVKDPESSNANGEDLDSDNDIDITKIEPTKAEAEAIDRGLQTIKNDDLEEIRELGSGTYGSVFHGKWKGSDVAIKRIKASCFAARPSERERLIADFWKEALILSSLHHPNVVSFYGIVRDGPDGSLATVTEFMVNGSLKQFLQKKDRTIDRRKRLIIAMDAAFGMEYLHGKNIVHFDLKCENLLVNMRDPQRPICKIGDLGLSKVKQHTLVSGGVRGTLPWMAPELLSGKSNMVTEKIDVYSFGIVMWELLTGEEPYADMHCASIIGGIVNNTLRPQPPTWCDPEWRSLMESCWACDPAERPSFAETSQKLRNMAAAMNLK